jgi:hypothetical protein
MAEMKAWGKGKDLPKSRHGIKGKVQDVFL